MRRHNVSVSLGSGRYRKTNVPKKVFLATNISELLSGLIPVKYKDPACPTIACTIR